VRVVARGLVLRLGVYPGSDGRLRARRLGVVKGLRAGLSAGSASRVSCEWSC